MSVMTVIMSALALSVGLVMGFFCAQRVGKRASKASACNKLVIHLAGVPAWVLGFIGILWFFMSPPPFSLLVSGPPDHHTNDPSRSVYFGNGCFWHTQYDFVLAEQEVNGVFGGRSDADITSLVGYAGGNYQSPSGTACYHGIPSLDYNRLGHSECVSITLSQNTTAANAQLQKIADVYFHGYTTKPQGRQRLDPQDMGAEYRNVIGLPGGMGNVHWWPIIRAANKYGMPLIQGKGGPRDDTEGEYVVYVYDSDENPFFPR